MNTSSQSYHLLIIFAVNLFGTVLRVVTAACSNGDTFKIGQKSKPQVHYNTPCSQSTKTILYYKPTDPLLNHLLSMYPPKTGYKNSDTFDIKLNVSCSGQKVTGKENSSLVIQNIAGMKEEWKNVLNVSCSGQKVTGKENSTLVIQNNAGMKEEWKNVFNASCSGQKVTGNEILSLVIQNNAGMEKKEEVKTVVELWMEYSGVVAADVFLCRVSLRKQNCAGPGVSQVFKTCRCGCRNLNSSLGLIETWASCQVTFQMGSFTTYARWKLKTAGRTAGSVPMKLYKARNKFGFFPTFEVDGVMVNLSYCYHVISAPVIDPNLHIMEFCVMGLAKGAAVTMDIVDTNLSSVAGWSNCARLSATVNVLFLNMNRNFFFVVLKFSDGCGRVGENLCKISHMTYSDDLELGHIVQKDKESTTGNKTATLVLTGLISFLIFIIVVIIIKYVKLIQALKEMKTTADPSLSSTTSAEVASDEESSLEGGGSFTKKDKAAPARETTGLEFLSHRAR